MKRILLTAFVGTALSICGCSSSSEHTGENKRAEIRVKTLTAGHDKKNIHKEYVGLVEGSLSAFVSFPVMGTIEKIHVAEGHFVKKGDILAELDAYSLTHAHTAALALLNQAEDAMKRMQMLYDSESLAEIKYIEMQTDLEKARSAEAIARKNLEDSRLSAPFSGVIGKKTAEVGENVMPNQSVFTLIKIDNVHVKVAVPEKEIGSIRLGQPASVRVSALNGESFDGVIAEKGIAADPVSHTYDIRITVSNTGNGLLPGMVGNAVIYGNNGDDVIVVPNHCVQVAGNGEKFVWKVSDGRAVKNTVRTGKQLSGGVEITHGLSGGEEIISEGYQKLSNGVNVNAL